MIPDAAVKDMRMSRDEIKLESIELGERLESLSDAWWDERMERAAITVRLAALWELWQAAK